MNFYLASTSEHGPELEQVRYKLEHMGHIVVSEWHKPENIRIQQFDKLFGIYRMGWALKDVRDVKKCDILVHRNPGPGSGKGGSHVEYGMAYTLGKTIVVIGEPSNVFQYLPGIINFPNWDELYNYLMDMSISCSLLKN